jgi:hypothetical protein
VWSLMGANADDYSKFHEEWGMNNGRGRFALPLGSRKVLLLYAIFTAASQMCAS